jgi:AraC-like DNA-binding protein
MGVLFRDLGIAPENVLRRAKMPLDTLAQEQAWVTPAELLRFWDALEQEADDPTLPIRLGKAASPEIFQPPMFAALCSPDLSVAAERLSRYKRLVAPVTMTVDEGPAGLTISKQWNDPTFEVPPGVAAVELVFLTQIARIGTRERVRPLKVESRTLLEPAAAYHEFFGVAPKQGKRNAVTFSLEDAHRPFLTASESLWQTFEPELRRRMTKLDATAPLSERVRSVLLESLPSGEASVGVIAKRLGLSGRTLQRKLKPEGTSFKQIVSSTREQLARHYVSNTSLAYAEISFLIGFEEPSSFFRAFREWTGETPETVRTTVAG